MLLPLPRAAAVWTGVRVLLQVERREHGLPLLEHVEEGGRVLGHEGREDAQVAAHRGRRQPRHAYRYGVKDAFLKNYLDLIAFLLQARLTLTRTLT